MYDPCHIQINQHDRELILEVPNLLRDWQLETAKSVAFSIVTQANYSNC